MKKIQKNAARFDNLKQDFLDDKKYSGTAEATLNGYRYDITRFLKFLSDEQLAVNEAGRNSTVQNQDGKGTRNHQGRLHAGRTLCADSAAETGGQLCYLAQLGYHQLYFGNSGTRSNGL